MATSTKFDAFDAGTISSLLGGQKDRAVVIAEFARDALAHGQDQNKRVLGFIPAHKTFVNGQQGAREELVRIDGSIVYEFELASEAVRWIADQLQIHSPVGSGEDRHPGLYKSSHAVFVDGQEIDPNAPVLSWSEIVFLNTTPYAKAIERGESSFAPNGVYEAVAALADARFTDVSIKFEFRPSLDGGRYQQPAIVLTSR